MKNILIVLLLLLPNITSAQNNIPKKMLKGIQTEVDEFTNSTEYTAKGCPISIKQNGDNYDLFIALSCSTWDTSLNLKKIYILVDGQTTIIEYNDKDFSYKEVPNRVSTQASSGTFGTSSYKPMKFGTRMSYLNEWKSNAEPYMDMINTMIIAKKYKVKFEGENGELLTEANKKDVAKIEAIMNLYNFLKSKN